MIVVPGLLPSGSKDGSAAGTLDLTVGDFRQVRLTGSQGLIGSRAGESAGHYIKLISLAPDLSNFKLYATSIARPQAKCGIAACNALPAGARLVYVTPSHQYPLGSAMSLPRRMALLEWAHRHDAAIIEDGVIKNRLTYEIMTPQSVGVPDSKLVLGKHSGRHALGRRCEQLGYEFSRRELDRVYKERQKEIGADASSP